MGEQKVTNTGPELHHQAGNLAPFPDKRSATCQSTPCSIPCHPPNLIAFLPVHQGESHPLAMNTEKLDSTHTTTTGSPKKSHRGDLGFWTTIYFQLNILKLYSFPATSQIFESWHLLLRFNLKSIMKIFSKHFLLHL
jgi:hypothetical protein